MTNEGTFSQRYGYVPPDAEITIREDAPEGLRATLLNAARRHLNPKQLRSLVCEVLDVLPDRSNWSAGNVWEEVQRLVEGAWWPLIYEIIEAMYRHLYELGDLGAAESFATEINSYFRRAGIGWQMVGGRIETRGSETFELTVRGTAAKLAEAGFQTAGQEVREALQDLSKRPEPDLTGALQHGMAALECVAREVCGDVNLTLGTIVKQNPVLFPKPLDTAVEKAWGYASERGRHLKEGQRLDRAEVEFVVGLAATVAMYLATKMPRSTN